MSSESKTVDLVRYVKKLKIRKQEVLGKRGSSPDKKEQLENVVVNIDDQISSVEKLIEDLKQSNLRGSRL